MPAYAAPALEKAFDVFELLATRPEGLTLSEIAAHLGRSINELFRLLVVMERRGYLGKGAGSDRYSVTFRLLDLGFRATPAQNLAHVAAPILYDLAHAVAQSCHLVVQGEDGRGLIVLRQENPGPTGFSVRLGASVELLRSCSGSVLLAFGDPDRLRTTLPADAGFRAWLADLEPVLADIRARGHAQRLSPMTHGVIDISYPVFGFDGRVAAALTIPFLERIDGSQPVALDDARALLAAAARTISAGLGWHGRVD